MRNKGQHEVFWTRLIYAIAGAEQSGHHPILRLLFGKLHHSLLRRCRTFRSGWFGETCLLFRLKFRHNCLVSIDALPSKKVSEYWFRKTLVYLIPMTLTTYR